MSEVKIPEGYKQTEVGVIPKDWEVKELGQIFELKSGETITSKNISSDDFYPCYGGNGLRGYTSTFNRNGEHVLIGRQGALCGNIEYVNDKFFASEHALVVSTIKNYSYKWLAYVLDRMHLNQYSESSAQPGLSALKLKKLKVSLPPIKEQTAIATALSDVDNLIGSLEKLIAKKEAIKTGTMQQLLTGKTRLPEFATREDRSTKGFKQTELGRIPEDWEVEQLIKLGEFQSGSGFPIKYQGHKFGEIPFFKVSDMNNLGNTKYLHQSNNYISEYDRLAIGARLVPKDSIIFAKVGAAVFLERKRILSSSACIDNNMMAFTPNLLELDLRFAYLIFLKINLSTLVETTALPSLSGKNIGKCNIAVPSKLEQTAIATILSDMDAEIQALQERLEKTKDIKQGMMQQLLTGKVRLLDSSAKSDTQIKASCKHE